MAKRMKAGKVWYKSWWAYFRGAYRGNIFFAVNNVKVIDKKIQAKEEPEKEIK